MLQQDREDVPWGIRAFDSDAANLVRPPSGAIYVTSLSASDLGAQPRSLFDTLPADSMNAVILELARGSDTVRAPWPLMVATVDTELPMIVRLDDDSARTGKTDSTTVGRTVPGGTYYWFFRTGTVARATGRVNDALRLSLSRATTAWVNLADAHPLPAGTPAPVGQVGSMVVGPTGAGEALRIPVRTRVPVEIAETPSSVVITLHGAVGDADWTRYRAANRRIIKRVDWRQDEDRVVIAVETGRLWGYRSRWEGTDLVLEVRASPVIDRRDPLKGRIIAIDPGHPPAGTIGPTGLREADANLAVSLRLAELVAAQGAKVVLTRRVDTPLDLNQRVVIAESAGAELLVSIHNNALPDGVNPFTNSGTSVFYNHAQSLPLARAVQDALVARLGLRDLGVARGDLAMVRPTWQPSILTEGVHLIVPEQEAAMRTPEGQDRYARGVLDGLRAFLQAHAEECEIPGC
jgi:N-acetylmuramoyl-L-alanine amidase